MNAIDNLNPSEAKQSQKELADRLATAYSLEKMRKAIGKLKASMEFQKGLEENLLGKDDEDDEEAKKRKAKRVAIKKEKAEFDNNEYEPYLYFFLIICLHHIKKFLWGRFLIT